MMNKIILPGSYHFDAPVTRQIKLSSHGLLGDDLGTFIKRAGYKMADEVRRIKFASGEVPVHLIAIGSTEYFGVNRNGDAFDEDVCRKFHHTFVKHARWHRNHCFVAGTPILMADRVRKPIEQVAVGDTVATLEGSKPVTAIMRNEYAGLGVKIRLRGIPTPTVMTEEHPVLVLRRSQVHCKHRYSRLGYNEHGLVCCDWRQGLRDMIPEYIPASSLRRGDYVLLPKPTHGHTIVEPAFARLVGWVASEGYLGKRGIIQFTFSASNHSDVASVTRCLRENGLHVTTTPRPNTGCVMLSACSTAVAAELARYVVGKLDQKRLTPLVLDWDAASLYEMLATYIEGDGHVARGNNRGQLRVRSSSPAMLTILSDIVRSLGIPATIQYDNPPGTMVSPTNGKVYQTHGSGTLAVNSHYAPQLVAATRKCIVRGSKRRTAEAIFQGCYLVRVNSVVPIMLNEPVYNFEVEGPHHYIANEIVVHNCNKDPSKSYGRIVHSAYNELMHRIELIAALNGTKKAADRNGGLVADEELNMLHSGSDIPVSMACARPGTLVKVRRGFMPIESIKPDDEVLTKYGRYCRVYATLRRVKQHIARVSTRFYGRQILEFTPDHKFWVARWQDIPAPPQRNKLRSADPTGYSKTFRRKYRDAIHAYARYVPCGDLKPGDLLLMPIDRGDGSSALGRREARLLGYYTAEGSVTSDNYLCFTCGIHDDFIREVRDLVDANYSTYEHTASALAVNIILYDKAAATAVAEHVGKGVRNKVVPRAVVDAPADIKLEFLAGWFNGDGWQDIKGLHWSTCSRTLSLELQNLLASIGVPASVYRIDHTSDLPNGVQRTGIGVEYTVNISNRYSALFAGRSKANVIEMRADKTMVFITGDYLAIPVKSVEVCEEECEVYDISVEDDESFTAFGLAVSNCTVPFDVCSSCNNKARTRAEYCKGEDQGGHCKEGGCATRLGQVNENGHHLHVKNTVPKFFDLSKVWRGADHTAYTLGIIEKAAAAGGVILGGAEIAERIGLTSPFELFVETVSEQKVASQLRLARQLSMLEAKAQKDNSFHKHAGAFIPAVQNPLPLGLLDSPETRAQGLKALALEKIALPLRDFLHMYLEGNAVKAAEMTPLVAPYLRDIYGQLTDHPEELAAGIRAGKYLHDPRRPTKEASAWARELVADYSLDPRLVERRAWRAALRDAEPRNSYNSPLDKTASNSGELQTIAKEYALYKLAMLNEIRDYDPNFVLTCDLAIRQNHIS